MCARPSYTWTSSSVLCDGAACCNVTPSLAVQACPEYACTHSCTSPNRIRSIHGLNQPIHDNESAVSQLFPITVFTKTLRLVCWQQCHLYVTALQVAGALSSAGVAIPASAIASFVSFIPSLLLTRYKKQVLVCVAG